MKHKNIMLLVTMILVLTCVGCGRQTQKDNSVTVPSGNATSNEQGKNDNFGAVPPMQAGNTDEQKEAAETSEVVVDENPSDADKLFEISKLDGTVTEFSDDGCKLSPKIKIGDNLAYSAAPGYEDTFVSVSYNSDCIFQIAHLDLQTAAATYEPATVKDVKKQTSLIICGEYDENDVLHASRIFIYRYTG